MKKIIAQNIIRAKRALRMKGLDVMTIKFSILRSLVLTATYAALFIGAQPAFAGKSKATQLDLSYGPQLLAGYEDYANPKNAPNSDLYLACAESSNPHDAEFYASAVCSKFYSDCDTLIIYSVGPSKVLPDGLVNLLYDVPASIEHTLGLTNHIVSRDIGMSLKNFFKQSDTLIGCAKMVGSKKLNGVDQDDIHQYSFGIQRVAPFYEQNNHVYGNLNIVPIIACERTNLTMDIPAKEDPVAAHDIEQFVEKTCASLGVKCRHIATQVGLDFMELGNDWNSILYRDAECTRYEYTKTSKKGAAAGK